MNELNPADLVSPPTWSLFIGSLGKFCIYAAAALFAISGLFWLAARQREGFAKVGKISFNAACVSLLGAFLSLGLLFAANRFEYEYVFGHADSKNALGYRIAGIWSGQEGSFLLWATCSAVFALFTVAKTGIYRRWYTFAFSFFLGGLASILAFESPFNLNLFEGKPFVPADGLGLAPSLQNYWVIIHPPTIFLGFGSLTALFALAFAALVQRDYETWIPIVRPLAIVSTTLVGVGLCMGGFWAYETLGWGGFWMWDPVENVSFVPWCFGAAFIHGVIVQATKKKWQMSNLLLGGVPFLAFVYGTFLTRSGFLSDASVHSFAEMDRSALKLLIGVMAGTGIGFLGLWGFRAFQARKEKPVEEAAKPGLRREAFYLMGMVGLMTMGVATMIGMSVPFIQAIKGQKAAVVEEALYHQVLPWIFIPIMVLMAITPFVAWRAMGTKELMAKVYTVLCVTIGLTGLVLFLTVVTPYGKGLDLAPTMTMLGRFQIKGLGWMMFLVGICFFVLVANVWRIAELFKRSKMGTASFFAHVGVAVLMAGLIISRGFEAKDRSVVMEDRPGRLMAYEVRYAGMTSTEFDRDNKLKLDIYDPHKKDSKPIFTATPGMYRMTMANGEETTMVWPHIQRGILMDTYVSLGQPQKMTGQDIVFKPGETKDFGTFTLTYEKMTRQGTPGQAGTRFGALLKMKENGKTTSLNPEMMVGDIGQSSEPQFVALNKQFGIGMVGMNANDKSVTLRAQMAGYMYPVEIYHKPMTILVWLGTLILTIAGFASAFYRRSTQRVAEVVREAKTPPTRKGDLVTAIQGDTR